MIDVSKIKKIGKKFITIKNNNFLSFKFILNLNFLINSQESNKKGINKSICFIKKRLGY